MIGLSMYSNKPINLNKKNIKDLEPMLSDDIKSLESQLKMNTFGYVDIAAEQAWKKALNQWPLLAEWDMWSKQ